MLKKILKILLYSVFFLLIILFTALSIKGQKGNPLLFQTSDNKSTAVGSPFESSGSTSRYALTEAIVEDKTFLFNLERAKFASPDVVESDGKYFSIFTPGVSFVGIPFYKLGKIFGMPQLFTYISTSVFALLNLLLIYKIARRLGTGINGSLLAGVIFFFATNAISYSLTFTQHHMSTFLVLLMLLLSLKPVSFINDLVIGIVYGLGIYSDAPNIILMFPILLFVLSKHIITIDNGAKRGLKVNLKFLLIPFCFVLVLIPFFIYNHQLTNSYFNLPQFIGRAPSFDVQNTESDLVGEQVKIAKDKKTGIQLPFKTRNELQGLYILVVSNERGIIYYSPIVLLGLLGIFLLYKYNQNRPAAVVFLAVILTNIFVYSMFGDASGGWAYGARYMIPSAALLSVGIGIFLKNSKDKIWFIPIFIILTAYSVGINVLGAMTTTQLPPKIEAVNLPDPVPYTYEYNFNLAKQKNLNSSLFYNIFANKYLNSLQYMGLYTGAVLILVGILYSASLFEDKKEEL